MKLKKYSKKIKPFYVIWCDRTKPQNSSCAYVNVRFKKWMNAEQKVNAIKEAIEREPYTNKVPIHNIHITQIYKL